MFVILNFNRFNRTTIDCIAANWVGFSSITWGTFTGPSGIYIAPWSMNQWSYNYIVKVPKIYENNDERALNVPRICWIQWILCGHWCQSLQKMNDEWWIFIAFQSNFMDLFIVELLLWDLLSLFQWNAKNVPPAKNVFIYMKCRNHNFISRLNSRRKRGKYLRKFKEKLI